MPSSIHLHRLRRARRPRLPSRRGWLIGLLAVGLSASALVGLAAGSAVLGLAGELPEVGRIEGQFGLRGAEAFRPLLIYDRSGGAALYQHLHPAAAGRVWVDPQQLPAHVVEATLAAVDPTFWSNSGFELGRLTDASGWTLTQRLAAAALLPPAVEPRSPVSRGVQNALLAAELARRYPKEQILTWYLNSADYGHAAYGIDAAALVYFGKHAAELELAEGAMLAALARRPELDPTVDSVTARTEQAAVLSAMVEGGALTQAEAERARGRTLRFQEVGWEPPGFASYAVEQIRTVLGPAILGRSGVRVISTLDQDLQQQAACAAASHASRLRGSRAASVSAAVDGSPCVAAALLPTLRPGDSGFDHGVEEWVVLVGDPTSGELLAAVGPIGQPATAGPALSPFLYLSAFARGSSPATMVIDLGPPLAEAEGPVRIRTALAGQLTGPEVQVLEALGEENLQRTLAQLGLPALSSPVDDLRTERVRPIDLARANGVVALEGRARGLPRPDGLIFPSILLRVEESDGLVLYAYEPAEQAIVSSQLAYLLISVLSDEPARWDSLGSPNVLEIGRPAAAVSGTAPDGSTSWAIGFTPDRVVVVLLAGSPLQRIDRTNGAAGVWHAVTRFASAGLPVRGWAMPPGLSELEVCEPSGLLPTAYCPEVVREVFIQGSEPTRYDDLYQPFRINSETGKLATLFTPLASIEERIYFVAPPEAEQWAAAVGLDQAPEEFDALPEAPLASPGAMIGSPGMFEIVGGEVPILGEATGQGFSYYRLQYGQGLNPSRWVQIGGDRRFQVPDGRLGGWSTAGLNGLYTLQLLVILRDGEVRTAATPLTLDNMPPSVRLLAPQAGEQVRLGGSAGVLLLAEAQDEVQLAAVEFLVDGRPVASLNQAPYQFRWMPPSRPGDFEIQVRATDAAGNQAESEPVVLHITS